MIRRTLSGATLVALLALSGLATVVADWDEQGELVSITGTVVVVDGGDGAPTYHLELADGALVKLEVGPPWYWGDDHPLASYVGDSVALEGHHSDCVPAERAADIARERAVADPVFKVRTIDGTALWTTLTPPWSGGPAVVGESHPGFRGWSWGQSRSGRGGGEANELAGGPAAVDESHPGFWGWSRGQAASPGSRQSCEQGR